MTRPRATPQSMLDFSGKSILVTGASQGIGAGIVRRFAEAGASVLAHYRRNEAGAKELVEACDGFSGCVRIGAAELSDRRAISELVESAIGHFDKLDVLINNAGIYPNSSLLDMSEEAWRSMFSSNLESTVFTSQDAARHMKERGSGSIINIASISGMNAASAHAHYNASKAAVLMFTQSAAQEWGPLGIRVNAVSPGLISREGIEKAWPDGVNRWLAASPLGRMGDAEDVADACLFLASDAAGWVTGINLPVEGGVLSSMIY